jgi:neutral ceramidase
VPAIAPLRAGVATVDITPESLPGLNAMGADFTAVHDRLAARAVVLEAGTSRVAVVSVDLLEIGVTVELRERIEARLGIPAHAVLIAASHSHNAPRAGRTPSGGLSRAASQESLGYTAWLFERIIAVVAEAQAALQPARTAFGAGAVDVNVNRDELRNGRWILGQDPAGPSDKTVRVIGVQTLDGASLATLIDYAVHPTASLGSRLVSADIAGAAARRLEQDLGGIALWLPGSIGDQAVRESRERRADAGETTDPDAVFRVVDVQGGRIADEAARVVRALVTWETRVDLAGSERTLEWPSKPGTDLPPDMHQDVIDFVALRLTLLVIGGAVLAGVGGEVTTSAAQRILAGVATVDAVFPILVSIANERLGYLADEAAFQRGTFAARGCPIQPGWESAAADMLAAMVAEGRG